MKYPDKETRKRIEDAIIKATYGDRDDGIFLWHTWEYEPTEEAYSIWWLPITFDDFRKAIIAKFKGDGIDVEEPLGDSSREDRYYDSFTINRDNYADFKPGYKIEELEKENEQCFLNT